jgi:hypothetical protein
VKLYLKYVFILIFLAFNPAAQFSCIFRILKLKDKLTKDTLHQSYNRGFSVTAVNTREETYWCVYLTDGLPEMASKPISDGTLYTLLQLILHGKLAYNITLSELLGTATACYNQKIYVRSGITVVWSPSVIRFMK